MGRYGDGLHPWGDLVAMARAQCVSKSGAFALIGVPTKETDRIKFNLNRQYGPLMLSHLFANFRPIWNSLLRGEDGKIKAEWLGKQEAFVLKKAE